MFWAKKKSEWELKIDICCSPHIEEPQWDIVMDVTDALNSDGARAKRVLAHLRRVLERSIAQSTDNQQLKNCLDVIDSLTRNGNDNIISVIHSSFLLPLSKLALSQDTNSAKLKSLLQSSENKKNCRDRVLELILDWQELSDIDQTKYPEFRATFIDLKLSGAPFNKIITERERISELNRQQRIKEKGKGDAKEEKQDYEDEPKYDNPWSNRNMDFGRWYKSKLKADISKLIDMMVMTQDIIAMKNVTDAELMTSELREANKRLISIMLRTADPPAVDCLLQLVTINSSLFDCYKKIEKWAKIHRSWGIASVSAYFDQVFVAFNN
eukprot:723967_1